ncbi:glycine zipper 2TM domain-containing protein [Bordetella sp. 2513F-2]
MTSPSDPSAGRRAGRGLHPLIAAAAVSVIVLCAVATGAILGWLPGPWAGNPPDAVATSDPQDAGEAAPSGDAPVDPPADPAPIDAAGGLPPEPPQPSSSAPAAAPPASQDAPLAQPQCSDCGVVESIRQVQVPAQGGGGSNIVGTVAGGVVGGVVGNQFGGGNGRDALTVLGAVGGALAGREIERNIRGRQTVTHYELTVRMDDGGERVFRSAQPFPFASGDHVRVENEQLLPR